MSTNGRRDDARRVVVTGMGVVTPIGETPAEFSASLRAGRSAITRWKHMDERTLSKIGGDMCDFDLAAHFERVGAKYPPDLIGRVHKVLRRTPLTGRLDCAAALQADIDAGLHDAGLDPGRVGHVAGGNNLNNNYFVQNVRMFDQDDPTRASRPFDARRQRFVPGEGAGAVILEALARARARGARIHVELLGGVSTCDATRSPKPVVEGQVRVMRGGLRDAGITPEQVNYINAHGASTMVADAVGVEAIKQLFGDHAYRIPINATKSMLGHRLTAAALVELVAVFVHMEDGYLHPTINLDEPELGFDLDFVPHRARPYDIEIAVSNSFGFGGLNPCVVVGRAP
jgi:3-oxoacyl-(acyl-carrier-protein) synthase